MTPGDENAAGSGPDAAAANSTAPGPASAGSRVTTPGLLGAAALTGFILILPSPEGLPPEAHRLAALFAGVLVLWSTEALPIAVTALLALALQPIFGLTSLVTGRPPTPGAIFGAAAANFMSSVFFFVLVMFAIAHAWVKTGLARRFALVADRAGRHRRHARGLRLHDRHRRHLDGGLRRAGRRHLHGHRGRHPRQAGAAARVAASAGR